MSKIIRINEDRGQRRYVNADQIRMAIYRPELELEQATIWIDLGYGDADRVVELFGAAAAELAGQLDALADDLAAKSRMIDRLNDFMIGMTATLEACR